MFIFQISCYQKAGTRANFYAAVVDMFQLQISHHQTVYVTDIKGNDISLPVVYI